MAEIGSYRAGRLVFAYLRSSATGKRELHPAIILDRDQDITQPPHFDPRKSVGENIIHVVGVSTKHKIYNAPYIQLPFAASGHAQKKLRQDCGAIIGWYHQIGIPDDVIGFGGDVPPAAMIAIYDAIRADLARKIGRELGTLKDVFEELFGEET